METLFNMLYLAFLAAVFLAVLNVAVQDSLNRERQREVARRGVEVEAEILARYEAGAPQGSDLAKARRSLMAASWDPLELELRYTWDGREIVARGRVSTKTFFRTQAAKTLKVKVSPDQPELWTALA